MAQANTIAGDADYTRGGERRLPTRKILGGFRKTVSRMAKEGLTRGISAGYVGVSVGCTRGAASRCTSVILPALAACVGGFTHARNGRLAPVVRANAARRTIPRMLNDCREQRRKIPAGIRRRIPKADLSKGYILLGDPSQAPARPSLQSALITKSPKLALVRSPGKLYDQRRNNYSAHVC